MAGKARSPEGNSTSFGQRQPFLGDSHQSWGIHRKDFQPGLAVEKHELGERIMRRRSRQ